MRPFIAWDGEAVTNEIDPDSPDHPYCLFGSSLGWRVKSYDLNTLDCLSLIIESEQSCPDAIHFGFAFGYDVNMIIRNIPLYTLHNLRVTNHARYQGFEIEYIPRKWFRVAYGKGRGRTSAKIFDTFSFFNASLGATLRKYAIGSNDQLQRIDAGKGERPNFSYFDITTDIEPYWETELVLMVSLMDKFRGILENSGIHISSWHGPGAIASYLLRNHSTKDYMYSSEPAIQEAARYAYFGGRFEPFKAGFYDGPIYSADINSAYPYAHSNMPNLSGGKWLHSDGRPDSHPHNHRIGLYRINYARAHDNSPMPLPYRSKSNSVHFPSVTNSWYHSAEAAMVYNDPNAQFLESWVYEDDGTYPFNWINDLYQERLNLKAKNDPTEYGIKLGINSLYGQVAQRVGYNRKTLEPPRWHQLEWAGAITSECRALVYMAARSVGKGLISVDTDGVLSSVQFPTLPNGQGDQLGQWKITEYSGLFYIQNGIYWLRDKAGNWLSPKSRGIPRKKLEFSYVYNVYKQGAKLTVNQHMFLGFGLALRGRIDEWRHWIDVPKSFEFGGTGKRFHSPSFCQACIQGIPYTGALHHLVSVPPKGIESYPHKLPWLAESRVDEQDDRYWTIELEKWGIVLE